MRKKVKVHPMYHEFQEYSLDHYIGEYDEKNNLIKVFNPVNQQLKRIIGTYQWVLTGTSDVFFIEEDPIFFRKMESKQI